MSKHYKRNIRRRRRRRERAIARKHQQDTHHLCYYKKSWRANVGANRLREFYYCKILIPRDTLHKRIHANVPMVPVPRSISALGALEQLRLLERYEAIGPEDPLEKRLMLLAALFDCIEQPTADAFRAQAEVAHEFYKEGG